MSKDSSERLADGDWTAEDWARNDPHAHPAAGDRQTYGEHTLDEYQQQWERDQAERQQRERWALQWGGE